MPNRFRKPNRISANIKVPPDAQSLYFPGWGNSELWQLLLAEHKKRQNNPINVER